MDTSYLYDPVNLPFKGESFVCASHFRDPAIRQYVETNGIDGKCSYCGKATRVMDLAAFMEYAVSTIGRYFVTVSNADLPLESSFYDKDDDDNSIPGYVRVGSFVFRDNMQPMDVQEMLEEVDLVTDNDSLNETIKGCFCDWEDWTHKEPLSMTTEEEDAIDWERFCDTIKHKRRFSIEDESICEDFMGYRKSISDIIDRIFSFIVQNQCLRNLSVGTPFFRSRSFESGEPKDFNDLTSPPDEYAKQNRMSPAGISMFYGALDAKTSVAEIGEYKGQLFLGHFVLKKEIRLVDLTKQPRLSYWLTADIGDIAFLRSFAKEVSKPITRDDNIHIEYLPTQAFTEYVRYRFKENGHSIDGILYNSSINPGGKNVVLFCNQKDSSNYLELTDITEYA